MALNGQLKLKIETWRNPGRIETIAHQLGLQSLILRRCSNIQISMLPSPVRATGAAEPRS